MPVVTKDVTSHGGANSWRRQVVVKGALRLLCLSCGLKISIHSCVCVVLEVDVARFQN